MHKAKNESPATALVVGGGLVGFACALNLQLRGIQTVVLDPVTTRRGASWGNAGHLAIEQVEPLASAATLQSFPRRLFWRGGALALPARDIRAWLPFALRLIRASRPSRFQAGKAALSALLSAAIPAWRRIAQAAGAGDLVAEHGHFIVWETPEGARAGRSAWAHTDIGTARFRDATEEELTTLAAHMSRRPAGAIRFLNTGQILDLGELAERLAAQFTVLGGAHRHDRVRQLDAAQSTVALVLESGETLQADAIVVAAGVASGPLLEPLGYKVPIIAERGYHIQSANTHWPADLPPVVFEERSMIVTRFRSGLRAASFVEFGRPDGPADPRKWARLRSHVADLGLSFGGRGSEWMGARPTLPDYLPAIGHSRRAANLFYAFGHQHLGLTLAAITGEAIGALVAGEASAINLAPFDIERFL